MDTGKNFEMEVRRSLKEANCFWFRIQDTNDVSRFVKKAIAEKQPGDFMSVFKGTPVLIECKTSRRHTAFPLFYGKTRSIPIHQVEAAQNIERHGGRAYFLIRKDVSRNKEAWAVTWKQVYKMYKTKSKSRAWEWFEENAIGLERLKNPVRWDIKKLFDKKL